MKASDHIAEFLAEHKVRYVFEMSGGMITHMLDSIHRAGRVRLISMHHEQGAGFAADAYGRVTGIPGVAMATSGPGATNLLTAVASCYFDSSPGVFITGQVNRNEQRRDLPIRQLGFQETDIVAMAAAVTKASWQVERVEHLPDALERAFRIATEGRPGPVLLDIPMDVQREQVTSEISRVTAEPALAPDERTVRDVLARIFSANRPLILAGGGVRAAGARGELRTFASLIGVPVVSSLMAVDALASDDPLRVGMLGSYGNRWANLAVGRSDLVLVLGSRLDIRQTGADTAAWSADRTIIQVDRDAGEINVRVRGCVPVVADVGAFLRAAIALASRSSRSVRAEWAAEIAALRARWPDTSEVQGSPRVNPNSLMHAISLGSGKAEAYVVDVGQHQMWAAQSLRLQDDQRFITSGGMGSMGFALPAAIGACLALDSRPIVVIAGDGGFQSNLQELQTVVRNELPLKIIVLNNGCHGMVRQFQESYFEARYPSTFWGYSAPDFTAVANAYGIRALSIDDGSDAGSALEWLWSSDSEPSLLEVHIDADVNVFPKIAFGRPMTEMEPFAKPIAMEGT